MAGTASLLHHLPCFTQLQHLYLSLPQLDTRFQPLQSLAALTASSHLTCLFLQPEGAQPLPAGALQCMFPSGRLMPHVREVTIANAAHEL